MIWLYPAKASMNDSNLSPEVDSMTDMRHWETVLWAGFLFHHGRVCEPLGIFCLSDGADP